MPEEAKKFCSGCEARHPKKRGVGEQEARRRGKPVEENVGWEGVLGEKLEGQVGGGVSPGRESILLSAASEDAGRRPQGWGQAESRGGGGSLLLPFGDPFPAFLRMGAHRQGFPAPNLLWHPRRCGCLLLAGAHGTQVSCLPASPVLHPNFLPPSVT